MTKLYKRTNERENMYDQMHMEANKHMGPTRKQPMNSPLVMYILPDLAPMQKQINQNINNVRRLERINSRRAWRYGRS